MADNDKKIACYICEGCGIHEAVDTEALSKVASESGAALCRSHPFLCGEEGVALVQKDLSEDGIQSIVLAACSPRAKQRELRFPGTATERVNLREGVAWILEAKHEDTQRLAEDYIRMGMAKAARSEAPSPFQEGDFYKDLLVVGGGVAGMTAALEAAKAGYRATLVEKTAELGGFVGRLHKCIPTAPPYRHPQDPDVGALIDAVKSHKGVEVLTSAEVAGIDGGPGKFEVRLTVNGQVTERKIGAIVLATGFSPYEAGKLGHLGHGKFKDVVTNVEFEDMARRGALVRPSNGAPVRQVLFLQCAGSRDAEHLPYCSGVCCSTTLKQATYIADGGSGTQVYVLHKDMRTPGQGEELYRQAQRDGAVFIRGEFKEVAESNGKLQVTATNPLLGDDVEIADLDMVVLATGMVSTNTMEGERVEPLTGQDLQKPSILRLNYRQGPELPNLRYGAPESHFICFPYETRRTGIYAAGTVRRPMNSAAARRDAVGAALKAIQCVELTSQGMAVHPRARDESYPEFFLQRCTQCKRCTEECPFGAINEDEKGNPLPNPTRCRRCGVCMGACPERIISFKDYSIDGIGSMVKSIEVSDDDEEKLFGVAMVCENDALPVLDRVASARTKMSPFLRFIPLRCLGSTNLVWIADALAKGIDGVLFLGCRHGDDYQCHFVKGSEICQTRLKNLKDTLDRLALEPERIRFEQVSMNDVDKVPTIVEEFVETLTNLGPNPYRGM